MEAKYAIPWQDIDTLLESDYQGEALFMARVTGKKTVVYQGKIKDNAFLRSSYTYWSPVNDPVDIDDDGGLHELYAVHPPPKIHAPPSQPKTADDILNKTKELLKGDRKEEYGEAIDMFIRIANLWNSYLEGRTIQASDVGVMMALMKIARLAYNPTHIDSTVDGSAYLALAIQVAIELLEIERGSQINA